MHAIYCLKETVNHYVENGSRVFCAFLDASKAFDRLVHGGLFLKLIERGVPRILLDVIIFWYTHLSCRVKWDDTFSDWFAVKAGVRQGGILSPNFYCLYVEDLIEILKQKNVGCYIMSVFLAALIYADDMAILAPSIKGITCLLRICGEYCAEFDIGLNAEKSNLMLFGKKANNVHDVELNGKALKWVEQCKYLGVELKSGKVFDCSITEQVRKFYRCANSIL